MTDDTRSKAIEALAGALHAAVCEKIGAHQRHIRGALVAHNWEARQGLAYLDAHPEAKAAVYDWLVEESLQRALDDVAAGRTKPWAEVRERAAIGLRERVERELDVGWLRTAFDNVQNMNPLDYLDDGDTIDAVAAEYQRLASQDAPASVTDDL